MSDILILGYYGFKNSGDDALLLSIVQQLRRKKRDLSLCVLSNNPHETKKVYGVDAVSRSNIFSVIKAVLRCRLLLVGGGTLIQDGTSTKSLLYYLFIIRLAELMGKKAMLYANGIGPLKEENRKITGKILNGIELITLRDKMSQDELLKTGVIKPETVITADSAFGLDYNKNEDVSDRLIEIGIPENVPYFCISVRDHKKLCSNFVTDTALICDRIYEKYGFMPVFMPFQKERDLEITEKIRKELKAPSAVFDTECGISELLAMISGAELCIGMRLHSLIYSAICTVPCVGLVYDPKVQGFMEYIGLKSYVNAENFTAEELWNYSAEAIENSEKIKDKLSENLETLRIKSEKNAELAVALLLKGKKDVTIK